MKTMKMPMPKKEKFQGPPWGHMSCQMNIYKLAAFKKKAHKNGFSMNRIMENWVDMYIAEGEK